MHSFIFTYFFFSEPKLKVGTEWVQKGQSHLFNWFILDASKHIQNGQFKIKCRWPETWLRLINQRCLYPFFDTKRNWKMTPKLDNERKSPFWNGWSKYLYCDIFQFIFNNNKCLIFLQVIFLKIMGYFFI